MLRQYLCLYCVTHATIEVVYYLCYSNATTAVKAMLSPNAQTTGRQDS